MMITNRLSDFIIKDIKLLMINYLGELNIT
jgi:hypothetical protein